MFVFVFFLFFVFLAYEEPRNLEKAGVWGLMIPVGTCRWPPLRPTVYT